MGSVLSVSLFLPLVAIGLIGLLPRERSVMARWIALFFTGASLLLQLSLFTQLDPQAGLHFTQHIDWFSGLSVSYAVGHDGVSLLLSLFSVLFVGLAVVASWQNDLRPRLFFCLLMLVQFGLGLAFAAQDLLLFIGSWQLVALPLFVLGAVWGGARRAYAAMKAFLYTALGGASTLVAALVLAYLGGGSASIPMLLQNHPAAVAPIGLQNALFLAFAAGFLVQLPVFPVQSWLTDFFEEAPLPVAGLVPCTLSPLAAYGLLRLGFGIMPAPAQNLAAWLTGLALFTLVYGAWGALSQHGLRRFVAFVATGLSGGMLLSMAGFTRPALQGAAASLILEGLAMALMGACVHALARRRGDSPAVGVPRELAGLRGFAAISAVGVLFAAPWRLLAAGPHVVTLVVTSIALLVYMVSLLRYQQPVVVAAEAAMVPLARLELAVLVFLSLLTLGITLAPPVLSVLGAFVGQLSPVLGL